MEIHTNTRTLTIWIISVLLSVLSIGVSVVAYSQWPPVFASEWLIGSILGLAIIFGAFSGWIWLIFPVDLVFRIEENEVTVSQRLIFGKKDISIHPNNIDSFVFDSENFSYIELSSGKRVWIHDMLLSQKPPCIKEIKKLFPSIKVYDK
ncbi:MAG: hypothetical protein WA081_04050 [Desulfosalsimonadaceae bacterium]